MFWSLSFTAVYCSKLLTGQVKDVKRNTAFTNALLDSAMDKFLVVTLQIIESQTSENDHILNIITILN